MKSITDILKRQVKWMKTLELKRKMGNAGSFLLEKIKQYQKQKQQNRIPEYEVSAGTGLAELVKKELADHFTSRRLIIILVLIYATSFASL